MKFSIIGVGKIGIYHAREFIKNGYTLTSIVCSTESRGKKHVIDLKEKYDVLINYYTNIYDLFNFEQVDLIVISSSTITHYEYLKICIECGIKYIFCEKPFIYNNYNLNTNRSIDLLKQCKNKNINLCVNTQWIYGIEQIKNYIPTNLKKITLYMEHYKKNNDVHFYTENLSHMNSIIIYLLGINKMRNITYDVSKYPIEISFYYKDVLICYKLGHPHNKNIIFKFNDTTFKRIVDKKYNQSFLMNGVNLISIKDPFSLSIKKYIEGKPLLNDESIIKNVELIDLIIKKLKVSTVI